MKVWQAILIFLLIGIIGLLGFNYMKLYLEFRGLKTDIEIQKMMENEKKEPAKDNIENVEEIENNNELEVEDKFYNVLENHSSKFNIYVHHETVEENIKRYLDIISLSGASIGENIPEFSDTKDLDESYLNQILGNFLLMNDGANLYLDYPGTVIHRDSIENFFQELFGTNFDISMLIFEDLGLYPLSGYDDIYCFNPSLECSELQDARYLIVDDVEIDFGREVTILEYYLNDENFVLEEGETTKRILANNEGETVKEYNVEGVKTSEIDFELVVTDNGNKVTDEEIEKFVLDNKDKFEMKKITFKDNNPKIEILSCEVVEQ